MPTDRVANGLTQVRNWLVACKSQRENASESRGWRMMHQEVSEHEGVNLPAVLFQRWETRPLFKPVHRTVEEPCAADAFRALGETQGRANELLSGYYYRFLRRTLASTARKAILYQLEPPVLVLLDDRPFLVVSIL